MAASEEPINRPTPREFFKSRTSDTFTKRFLSFAFLLVHMSLSQGTLPRSPLLPPAPPCTSTVPVSSRGTVIASPHPHPPAPPPAQFLAQKRCSVRICEVPEETYPSGRPASLPSLKPQGWPGLCCSSLCRPPWQDRNGARVPPPAAPPLLPGLSPVHLMPTAVSVIEKPTGHTRATSRQPPWLQARSQPYSPQGGPWASETGSGRVSMHHA